MFVGDKVEMQPSFRDILKPNRHVPWLPWRNHENRYLVSRTGRHQPDWRMATESENASRPRHDGAMETVECRTLDVAELLEKHDVTSVRRARLL
jgi:hypothetical protein